ncbi:UDP-N-acetylmuramoyl-tripeptide--D-alanyl-D-alanine ligase [Lactobacillus sp. S2-2]|uniref:UDP-N-acetylmuramoyl-tripeptide--D-alanyl-D- alanine ligase n=1 Tax=Lactobacillus sp. S2-2 TaxID=2692917 RepID=UPI001F3421A0|nr:UDP-N-acetylmuramoyl-tripeptide--D-alanyl-D-alanine ligase [Lactobacillus sp. S2-2]MCF6515867.1 UDP-N-acetylmuramoyl-tripeptide--D-alanyl-D-alanine ligase [Lactobacillus sp. S2-2]
MKMSLQEIAKAVNAEILNKNDQDITVEEVSFDSRKIGVNSLFIPLKGEQDGHKFIESAINNGAVATFFENKSEFEIPKNIPILKVENALESLQKLSRYYLKKINPEVIAITGSNGKTTTKDMVASVLSTKFNVTKTNGNFNNEIGVPITILSMKPSTETLVVEFGMDRPGQLNFLSKLVQPDVAIITMIGEAHIEFFKTRDKIADAKMEITNALKTQSFFIYNGDEHLLNDRAKNLNDILIRTFGKNTDNNLYSTSIHKEKFNTLFTTNKYADFEFEIPMIGEYNVNNALAAIMVGDLYEIKKEDIKSALKSFDLTENRTEWIIGAKDEKILSDVYNSNPTAVKNVLNAFVAEPTNGHKIIVLGDMLELGDASAELHKGLANDINPAEIKSVYLIGNEILPLYNQLKNKYAISDIHYYKKDDMDSLYHDLNDEIEPKDYVLLKGSHGIHLEKLLDMLKK